MTNKKSFLTVKWLSAAILLLMIAGTAQAEFSYKPRAAHPGGNVTPVEAMRMITEYGEHTHLIDVRTTAEYVFVGHPTMAFHVPLSEWRTAAVGWGSFESNPGFAKYLRAKFDLEKDRLLFICRSGSRSIQAVKAAVAAGFKPELVYNVMGGFEGDRIDNPAGDSAEPERMGGWRNENLPWTYALNPQLLYQPDLIE